MLAITVYFNNGCVISCDEVRNSKSFWRKVSKWCKHTNRSPFFNRYCSEPMRVERVERVVK